ncbi:Frizzled and smoothened-like protein [Actinidia chinensis var. chinensis]|uniref:Frizzled and smoothened-like protein n=1 Tax=Actinidia chinensis var. chinensis TaxID=1590841 RepID=A0A2R6QC52_ACTCC|nr:Frizzled and smoothened-like protein [Actinidia chinensis var. chinensis]
MNHYNQNQPQVAYPPPSTAYSAAAIEGPYVVPPPMGYPMKDVQLNSQNDHPQGKTQARGDGFWKGCCAALCCCCVLDACF